MRKKNWQIVADDGTTVSYWTRRSALLGCIFYARQKPGQYVICRFYNRSIGKHILYTRAVHYA